MSVISIRPATEKLQNLGDLRRPDRMPHFVAPDRSGQAAMARSYGDLGRGVGRLGDALAAIAIKAKREDEDRRLAAAGVEYQRRLQAGFLEGDNALLTRQGDDLEGEGLKRTENDKQNLFTTSFDEVCSRYEIDGKLKDKFALHVAPVALSWNGRMDSHVMTERQKNKITAADNLFDQDQQTWANDRFNAEMTQKLLDDYDHKLQVRGVTEKVRADEVRKYALGLAADIARSSFDGLDSEEAFDNQIKVLEEKPDELFADNTELKTRLGSNALPEDTVKLLVSEAKVKKENFVREQMRTMNAEVDALIAQGGEAAAKGLLTEMDKGVDALREKGETLPEGSKVRLSAFQAAARLDKAADTLAEQEMVAEYLEGQKTDPNFRLKYPEGTRKGRLCEQVNASIDNERAKRTQEGIAENKESLSRSLSQLEALELDGSISPEEASLTQAAIWAKFRKCVIAGTVPTDFMKSFRSRLETRLSDQEANAMRKFYRAFGYAPELQPDGDAGVSVRNAAKKDTTEYYAPLEEDGQRVESRKTRVKATELLEYGDALLRTLRELGPDVSREGVVDKEITRLKSEWIKGEVKKNIQATVDAARKSAILLRGRLGDALDEDEGEVQQGKGKKGHRDDDNSASR